jgi:Organic solute transporter Ostalpha
MDYSSQDQQLKVAPSSNATPLSRSNRNLVPAVTPKALEKSLPPASLRSVSSAVSSSALLEKPVFDHQGKVHVEDSISEDLSSSVSTSSSIFKLGGEEGSSELDITITPTTISGLRSPLYKRLSRILLALTYVVVIIISCILIWQLTVNQSERIVYAWAISGMFVALTLPLSINDLHMHCIHYISRLQKHYIRIIFLVPIYSVESWLALRFPANQIYLSIPRDAYEAYVIHEFYILMLSYLGGKDKVAQRLIMSGKERFPHVWPVNYCTKGWVAGRKFIHRCTVGVYQYVFLRVICSAIALICEATGSYRDGNWSPAYFYVFNTVIINCSQIYALYCLALFYLALKKDLAPLSPIGKFALVKAVVFVLWWQGLGISAAATLGLIQPIEPYDVAEVQVGLQNFLVCIEMFFAAIAITYFYSYKDFYDEKGGGITPLIAMQTSARNISLKQRTNVSDPSAVEAKTNESPKQPDIATPAGERSAIDIESANDGMVSPASMGTVFMDILPLDIMQDTATQIKTGFGLKHKWEKRRMEKLQQQKQIEDWVATPNVRSRRSKFIGAEEGEAVSTASSPVEDPVEDPEQHPKIMEKPHALSPI